jgi:hypothetical protein
MVHRSSRKGSLAGLALAAMALLVTGCAAVLRPLEQPRSARTSTVSCAPALARAHAALAGASTDAPAAHAAHAAAMHEYHTCLANTPD